MTDGDKLLRAVCESPAGDTSRLVSADWLEEHGQEERAEFIRVQCRLAVWTDPKRCPECGKERRFGWREHGVEWTDCRDDHKWRPGDHDALRQRERELYATSAEWLLPSLPGAVDGVVYAPHEWEVVCRDTLTYGFVGLLTRGFVSALTCTAADWLAHADALAWPPESVACRACSGEGCAQHGHGDQSKMCDGSGRLALPRPTDPCPECGGLKRGDMVEPAAGHHLACGSGLYTYAVVVSLNPFALVSPGGDMLWTATQTPETVSRIGPAIETERAFQRWDVKKKGRQPSGSGDSCPKCAGVGRAPRPFPPTAQPVTAVTLTTWPEWEVAPIGDGYGRLVGRSKIESLGCIVGEPNAAPLIRKLLAAEWPWIAFELPAAEVSREEFNRITGGILERFAAASEAVRQFGEAAAPPPPDPSAAAAPDRNAPRRNSRKHRIPPTRTRFPRPT